MDEDKKRALNHCRDTITGNVNTFKLTDYLYGDDVILGPEFRRLLDEKLTGSERAGVFLDCILERNTNQAYDAFLDALKTDYLPVFTLIKNAECPPTTCVQEVDCQETLVLGNFPKLPPYYIERSARLIEIRTALRRLKSRETLVLHGMVLIGKSCLAAAALQDKQLLKTAFNGKVFWVNLAEIREEVEDKDKILQELHRLLVSIGANFDSELVTNNVDENLKVQQLQAALRKVLSTPQYHNTLLVLDKLRCPNIVDYFDVGCKLFTTTCDLNFVPQSNCRVVIKLTEGFTERETKELFQKCLDAKPNQLTHDVKQIHSLCKGHPMLVSLIASYLEESKEWAVNDEFLWMDVIKKLRCHEGPPADLDIEEKLTMALDLCINKLPQHLQKYYVDLAVFAEDVNITSKVLETLWDLDRITVRRIMTQLEKKALVMSFFNSDLQIYVYMIHNLLLGKLRKMLPENRNIELHEKLIDACENLIANGDLKEMEADDYILQYFGYHLQKAEMFDRFNVYFDLKFIAAKIKVVGCADLLRDFQIYRRHITRGEHILEKKLEEYEKFVSEYGGILHKYKYTDIIQCALQLSSSSFIYEAAVEIAKQNPERLYFRLQLSPDTHYFTHILELECDVTAACFTNNTDHILVGTETGAITMWEQHYRREICRFTGHSSKITNLILDPVKSNFLSVSADGTVRLWSLRGLTPRNSLDAGDCGSNNIPSPYLRQNRYYAFTQCDQLIETSKVLETRDRDDVLVSAAFSNNDRFKVATGSKRGKVTIWNVDTMEIALEIPACGSPASCLAFSCDDNLIIFTRKENILLYSANDGSYLAQLCNQSNINQLLVVPKTEDETHRLVAINERIVTTHKWKSDMMLRVNPLMRMQTATADDYSFVCGAVMKDGRCVVTGSSDSYLRTWDIYSNSGESIIEKFNEGKVVCLDTFLKDKNDSQVHILLVVSSNKTAKQWYVHNDVQDTTPVKNLPVFATFWKQSSNTPLVAVVNTHNKIQILNGYKLIAETEVINSGVKIVCFSLDGNQIIFGLENGEVYKFSYKTRFCALVVTLTAAVSYLNCFEDTNDLNCAYCDGILVAAAVNGDYIVWKCDETVLHSKQLALKVVFCVFLRELRSFLVVKEKREICLWDLTTKTEKCLLDKHLHLNVVSCALAPSGGRFICVLENGTFEMYAVVYSRQVEIVLEQQKKLVAGGLRCCCFSFDEKFVAFGRENGGIVVWDVAKKETVATLELHHNPVRHLAFSPEPDYVLVSLSEQIAWWNIGKAMQKTPQPQRRFANGKPQLKHLNLTKQYSKTDLRIWNNKQTRADNLCLLATAKLLGTYANYVSVSPNFSSFATVDNNGKIYIAEVFDNVC